MVDQASISLVRRYWGGETLSVDACACGLRTGSRSGPCGANGSGWWRWCSRSRRVGRAGRARRAPRPPGPEAPRYSEDWSRSGPPSRRCPPISRSSSSSPTATAARSASRGRRCLTPRPAAPTCSPSSRARPSRDRVTHGRRYGVVVRERRRDAGQRRGAGRQVAQDRDRRVESDRRRFWNDGRRWAPLCGRGLRWHSLNGARGRREGCARSRRSARTSRRRRPRRFARRQRRPERSDQCGVLRGVGHRPTVRTFRRGGPVDLHELRGAAPSARRQARSRVDVLGVGDLWPARHR